VRAFGSFVHQQAHVLRDNAQHRALQRSLYIVNRFYAGIQIFNKERQPDPHYQADDDAQSDIKRLVGTHRSQTGHRAVHHFNHQGFGQFHVNLFKGNFRIEHLAEALQFLQCALGFKIWPRQIGLRDVVGCGPPDFLLQVD